MNKSSFRAVQTILACVISAVNVPSVLADACDEMPAGNLYVVPWTAGLVRFDFHPALSNDKKLYILRAMDIWMEQSGANIKFVRDIHPSVAPRFKVIVLQDGAGPYASYVGMNAIADYNLNVNNFGVEFAVHELGHILGWFHEHQRPDRGSHIDVKCENISSGREGQYKLVDWPHWMPNSTLAYDYQSIMHYGHCFNWNEVCEGPCTNLLADEDCWTIDAFTLNGDSDIGRWDTYLVSDIDAQEARAVYGTHPPGWVLPARYVGRVADGFAGSTSGTIGNPYLSFNDAYFNQTPTSSELFIAGEHQVGSVTLNKVMYLKNNGGDAVIKY